MECQNQQNQQNTKQIQKLTESIEDLQEKSKTLLIAVLDNRKSIEEILKYIKKIENKTSENYELIKSKPILSTYLQRKNEVIR